MKISARIFSLQEISEKEARNLKEDAKRRHTDLMSEVRNKRLCLLKALSASQNFVTEQNIQKS